MSPQKLPTKEGSAMQDAFEIDLKVNNDFGGVPDIDAVDQLRSIGSVSMNQGPTIINHLNSPLVPQNQYHYL